MSEKRLLALLAAILGLVAGVLILVAAAGARTIELLAVLAGIGILYGSYLIYRGKSSWFSLGKTRTGAFINLIIGILVLFIPGGIGGLVAILAIVSGVLGLMAA